MANATYSPASASVTVLNSELSSLANNTLSGLSGSGTGVVLDNTTNADLFGNFEALLTFGTAPTVQTTLDLYAVPSLDGTNYAQIANAPPTEASYLVGSFTVEATTSAQRIAFVGWNIPGPYKFKFALHNNGTGQTLTSGTVKVQTYSVV
jgi:hypothetical protein